LSFSRIDAVPLLDNGPLFERSRQFELGCTFDCLGTDLAHIAIRRALGRSNAGWWECELPTNTLSWTTGVYTIFGLPRAARITRGEAVSLYSESSRQVLERLRSFAIDNATGFIMDAQIHPANGERERWMRLIGAPLVEDGRTIGLYGFKIIV
jgi:PAS domain-containing protein